LSRQWTVRWTAILAMLLAGLCPAQEPTLIHRVWFELRTPHFQTYSCAPTQEVAGLAARLEQFHQAYAFLAGTQSVASPPIVVMAFPTHAALEPFLPTYQGQPANLAAFFARGSDENLIALSVANAGAISSLEAVFHEYAHLLLRHNGHFWPMWLKEGMADIYSTFEVIGDRSVRIGQPVPIYLHLLSQQPLLPLRELFAVGRDSPEYNERDRQGIFYAESWLLTHYLMLGGNPWHKAHFGDLTRVLREGQSMEVAFTNVFRTPLPAMQKQLRDYLQRGRFEPLRLTVRASLYSPQAAATRGLTPVETCFRLGDELLRVGRATEAEVYFEQGRKIAPASPFPYEGLGMLAAERHEHATAVRLLQEAVRLGSRSYLTHYLYAREILELTAKAPETFTKLDPVQGDQVRSQLERSLALMPEFGPAHHLLGFFELLEGENLGNADEHLQRAIQLEPENEAYRLTLAQVQLARSDPTAARRTLELLRRPYVEAEVRTQAEEMLNSLR